MEAQDENNEIKRERIRVKKRIKVKKKSSDPAKKAKKVGRGLMWLVVIVLFIYALFTLVKESDIRDKNKSFFIPPVIKTWLTQYLSR